VHPPPPPAAGECLVTQPGKAEKARSCLAVWGFEGECAPASAAPAIAAPAIAAPAIAAPAIAAPAIAVPVIVALPSPPGCRASPLQSPLCVIRAWFC
jgi:hypothetical protein